MFLMDDGSLWFRLGCVLFCVCREWVCIVGLFSLSFGLYDLVVSVNGGCVSG